MTLLIDFIGLLHSSMASNNLLAMEVEFPTSEMLLSRSSHLEFFYLAKRRINAFNSDFIKVVSVYIHT